MSRTPASLLALASSPPLRRALASYQLYGLVEMTVWVGMVLYAFDTGGAPLAGLVAVVELVPAALLSPVIVTRVEGLSRGTALGVAQGAVAAASLSTMTLLLMHAPVGIVVVAATITLTAIAVVRPLYFASLPQLAETPAALVSANSLSSVSEGVSYFLAPVIAGFGTQLAGTWFVFAIASILATTAAVLCVRLGLRAPASSSATDGNEMSWRRAFTSLGSLWGEWGALALLLVMATRFVIGGALDILGISFSEDVLGRGPGGAGLLIGAIGIGGLVGALVAGPLAMRRRLVPVIGLGGLLQGLGLAAVALVSVLAPAMLALVICGVGGAVLTVAGRTLLQRTSDEGVLARVFAVQEGTSLLGWALGSALAPMVIAWLASAGAFALFGMGCALFTLAALIFIRRLDGRALVPSVAVALLRQVPFLAILPPYELERMAAKASWTDVAAGDVVIRQGAVGDAFYVVADGAFEVSVDDVPLAGVLRAGEGFGEIALLHAVPRTATVTALSTGRVLTVSSPAFLAAVTDSEDGRAIAAEVTAARLRPREE
jgi:hypothetical protein